MPTLKPCPFCNYGNLDLPDESTPHSRTWVLCWKCNATGPATPQGGSISTAVDLWNNRPK